MAPSSLAPSGDTDGTLDQPTSETLSLALSKTPSESLSGTTTVHFGDGQAQDTTVSTFGFVFDVDARRLAVATVPSLGHLEHSDPGETPTPDPAVDTFITRGVATHNGEVYFVTPDRKAVEVVDCLGGRRRFGFAQFEMACGLAVSSDGLLLVADRGAGRVDGYRIRDEQLSVRWSGLDEPEDVAVADDRILAATTNGVRRLQAGGGSELIHPIDRPRSITTIGNNEVSIVVGTNDEVLVFHDEPATFSMEGLSGPFFVAADHQRLYVAAPRNQLVRSFGLNPEAALGDLPGAASILGIAICDDDQVWVATTTTVALSSGQHLVRHATATIGPIPLRLNPGLDNFARVSVRGQLGQATLALSVDFQPNTSGGGAPSESPHSVSGTDRLIAIPPTATEATIHLSIETNGNSIANAVTDAAPWIDRVRLAVNEPGLIDHLPEIYRSEGESSQFLDPFLRLLASGFGDIEDGLSSIPSQLDPGTAIDDLDGDRWLDWLATLVDASLEETWTSTTRRQVVGEAFHWHARRGTAAALRRRIKLEHNVEVTISEPAEAADVWVLGADNSELGFTTMATAAPAEGSILDRTAKLDRSHLIGPADAGSPLFGDLAHRFTVHVQPTLGVNASPEAIGETIEREKPAHTHVHLCLPSPGIAVGQGSAVGVDMIVADPNYSPTNLNDLPNGCLK